jgi:hypothetical protein
LYVNVYTPPTIGAVNPAAQAHGGG